MSAQPLKFNAGDFFIGPFLLCVSILLVFLSYFMELEAYRSIFAGINYNLNFPPPFHQVDMAQTFAFTFNAAKIGLIYLVAFNRTESSGTVQVHTIRISLLAYSFMMSLLIISGQFVDPNVKQVFEEKQAKIEDRFLNKELNLSSNNRRQIASQESRYTTEIDRIDAYYQPLLDEAKAGMAVEKNNYSNGIWKGTKFIEWESKFALHEANRAAQLGALRINHQSHVDQLNNDYLARATELEHDMAEAQAQESIEKSLGSFSAQNPLVVALISLLNDTLYNGNNVITAHHITLFVTIFISLNIEFVPLLLLGHIFGRMLSLSIFFSARKQGIRSSITKMKNKSPRDKQKVLSREKRAA